MVRTLLSQARIAVTKNGVVRLSSPPELDLGRLETGKKITDEEILKLLDQPLARSTGSKNKNKKKKKKKVLSTKPTVSADEDDEESSEDE